MVSLYILFKSFRVSNIVINYENDEYYEKRRYIRQRRNKIIKYVILLVLIIFVFYKFLNRKPVNNIKSIIIGVVKNIEQKYMPDLFLILESADFINKRIEEKKDGIINKTQLLEEFNSLYFNKKNKDCSFLQSDFYKALFKSKKEFNNFFMSLATAA